jgi:hypothetical protein
VRWQSQGVVMVVAVHSLLFGADFLHVLLLECAASMLNQRKRLQ